jgi:hypothetical protein
MGKSRLFKRNLPLSSSLCERRYRIPRRFRSQREHGKGMSAEQLRLFIEALEEAEEADDGDQPELLEQRGAALELGRDWGEGGVRRGEQLG